MYDLEYRKSICMSDLESVRTCAKSYAQTAHSAFINDLLQIIVYGDAVYD